MACRVSTKKRNVFGRRGNVARNVSTKKRNVFGRRRDGARPVSTNTTTSGLPVRAYISIENAYLTNINLVEVSRGFVFMWMWNTCGVLYGNGIVFYWYVTPAAYVAYLWHAYGMFILFLPNFYVCGISIRANGVL